MDVQRSAFDVRRSTFKIEASGFSSSNRTIELIAPPNVER
jgi:hypothetical protein